MKLYYRGKVFDVENDMEKDIKEKLNYDEKSDYYMIYRFEEALGNSRDMWLKKLGISNSDWYGILYLKLNGDIVRCYGEEGKYIELDENGVKSKDEDMDAFVDRFNFVDSFSMCYSFADFPWLYVCEEGAEKVLKISNSIQEIVLNEILIEKFVRKFKQQKELLCEVFANKNKFIDKLMANMK